MSEPQQAPTPEQNAAENTKLERKMELQIAKTKAVTEVMFEIMSEAKEEIVRRAQAKLIARGFLVEEIEAAK